MNKLTPDQMEEVFEIKVNGMRFKVGETYNGKVLKDIEHTNVENELFSGTHVNGRDENGTLIFEMRAEKITLSTVVYY